MVPPRPYPLVDPNSKVSYMVIRIETQKVPSLSYFYNYCCMQILPMVKILPIVFVDPSHTFKAYLLEFDSFSLFSICFEVISDTKI
jgi:hypothetical protein